MRKRVLITALVIAAMIVAIFGIVYSTAPSTKLKRALDNGTKYLNDMNYEEAKAQFLKALDIDPQNADALKGLVSVYITEAENTVDSEDSAEQPDLYEEDDYNEAISILTSGIKEINSIRGITENVAYDSEMDSIRSLIAVYEKNRDALWNGVSSKKLSDYKMDIVVTNGMKGESLLPVQNNNQAKETAPAPKLEEMTTVYGSTYYIPEGFRDVTSEVFDYERNAAGGYSSVYRNDSLGMEIQVDEFVWGNIVGFDSTAGSFLYQDYDYSTSGSVIDARMYDDYFYTLNEDANGQKYVYMQEMVNDTFCSVITCTYPKNSKECEEVRDQFLGSFSMSE